MFGAPALALEVAASNLEMREKGRSKPIAVRAHAVNDLGYMTPYKNTFTYIHYLKR
tara:strand:+ start:2046 stop:2213 length:168 start_codon:yes stop_codon:yes gene_type:complete